MPVPEISRRHPQQAGALTIEKQVLLNECAIVTDSCRYGTCQQLYNPPRKDSPLAPPAPAAVMPLTKLHQQQQLQLQQQQQQQLRPSEESLRVSLIEQSDPVLSHTLARIVGVTKQEDHCSYVVLVQTEVEQFVVHKRYTDFRLFRDELVRCSSQQVGCNRGPCRHLKNVARFHFPKRTLQFRYQFQEDLVRRRTEELNGFLTAVLSEFRLAPRRTQRQCELRQCMVFKLLMRFFDLDKLEKQQETHQHPPRVIVRELPTPTPSPNVMLQAHGGHPFSPLYPITEDFEVTYDITRCSADHYDAGM